MKIFNTYNWLATQLQSRQRAGTITPRVYDYLMGRMAAVIGRNVREIDALHRASGRGRFARTTGIAMSINHLRDDDTAFYDDELAASCGL